MTADDLIDRALIHDHVQGYAIGIDQHKWDLYRAIFADTIRMDFSSWSGTPATDMSADDWVAGVRATLDPFDATQHVLTNFLIDNEAERATCRCYVNAHHHLVLNGERHMHSIGGHYEHQLIRSTGPSPWLITATTLNVTWEMGDRGLFDLAAKRAAGEKV